MDFNLSEDHRMLAATLRRFLADNASFESRVAVAHAEPWHSPECWTGLAELGVIGAFLGEKHGGFGGTAEDVGVVFEELGRSLCVEPVLGTLMGVRLLAGFGRLDLVADIVAGESRCALAVFEPGAACDLDAIETEARQGADGWRLTGRKSAVYGAPGARHVLVVARTPQGIGLFLAENPPLVAASMVDGGGIADIPLDALPAACLSPDCAGAIEDALDLGRIALCAEAVGAMAHLIDMTTDYLKQRRQFGGPIARFQALQHRVVDMLVGLEQCRSITIGAVAAYGGPDGRRFTSMAKNLVGRVGTGVAEEAIQLHGGIGMTWEYAGAHYAKRLVMIDHQLGDRDDHSLRLVRLALSAEGAAR